MAVNYPWMMNFNTGKTDNPLLGAILGGSGNITKADPLANPNAQGDNSYSPNDTADEHWQKFRNRIDNILHPNTYDAKVDINADQNTRALNGIASAKLDYEMARQRGDIQGMYAAHERAEAIRRENPNLPSFAATGEAAGFNEYKEDRRAFDRTKDIYGFLNQYNQPNTDSKTPSDFMSGTGAYAKIAPQFQFPQMSQPQQAQNKTTTPAIGTELSDIVTKYGATLGGNPPVAMITPGVAASKKPDNLTGDFATDANNIFKQSWMNYFNK